MTQNFESMFPNAQEGGEKVLNLNDKAVNFSDSHEMVHGGASTGVDTRPEVHLKGRVQIVDDETGEVILDKNNLIVLRGRVFALEKIFGIPNTLEMGFQTANLNSKTVCLFKVGKGGTVEGQPFNVIPTIPSDSRALGQEIPFRLEIPGDTSLHGKYFDRQPYPHGQSETMAFFAKKFDNVQWGKNIPEGLYQEDQDEVYVKLTLKIERGDFATVQKENDNGAIEYHRSTFMNEIGLFIANHIRNDVTERMEDIEMFSRLTFESEPFFNNSKTLTIYYFIYA